MKHASKILVGVIVLLTVLSVSATFYKTVILQDFEIVTLEEELDENTEESITEEKIPFGENDSTEVSTSTENNVQTNPDGSSGSETSEFNEVNDIIN